MILLQKLRKLEIMLKLDIVQLEDYMIKLLQLVKVLRLNGMVKITVLKNLLH